jgi:hypothetical protein
MRWTKTKKEEKDLKSMEGKIRYTRRFLFFPHTIKHYYPKEFAETRWLELVTIKQEYYYFPASFGTFWFLGTEMPCGSGERGYWSDQCFVDKEPT